MEPALGRRIALKMFGLGMAAGAAGLATLNNGTVSTAETALLLPAGKSLEKFTTRLSRAPRRRDFETVPMILNDPTQWDHATLSAVIAYRGAPKQVWDNNRDRKPVAEPDAQCAERPGPVIT